MTTTDDTLWDLLIVGAGSAGSAIAWHAAHAGLRTLVLERRPLDRAGARWVNAVPGWCFDDGAIPRPAGDELRGTSHRFHLVAGWGPTRVAIAPRDVLDVDMRGLIGRLRDGALAAGAVFEAPVTVDGAIAGPSVSTSAGPRRARLIVDATGIRAHLHAAGSPPPPIAPGDICAAAQAVFRIADPEGARAFLGAHGAAPHESISFTGVAGGFSVVVVRVEGDDTVSILTGSRPAAGHPGGSRLLADFVRREPWIGERLFGGHAPIPLSPRRHGIVSASPAGPIVRLGDAAAHVFSAHGSGVGLQLVAARMLAEALAADPSATRAALTFERRFQRRFGLVLGASDLFRRVTQGLSPRALDRLIRSGLMHPRMLRVGLEQRLR